MSAKRILILGESNYEWCEECRTHGRETSSLARLTCYTVAAQLLRHPARYERHWSSIELAMVGEGASEEDRKDLWHHVAYANYIAKLVGFEHQARPDAAMWKEAESAFLSLLEGLRPKIVFVLGEGIWRELPPEHAPADALTKSERTIYRLTYRLEDGSEVMACRLRHPRAGLGRPWQPVVMQALSVVN